jgi:hypothetical protein
MEGAAAMVQILAQVLIVGLLIGLAGIIWMVIHDIFGDDHHADDKR